MAQLARPNSDYNIGAWIGDPNSITVYANINEPTANDANFVRSEHNPSNSSCLFMLSSVTDPETNVNHIVRYRYKRTDIGGGSGPTMNLTVTLYRNTFANIVQSNTHNSIGTEWVDGSFTLTGTNADAITSYSTLGIQFTFNKTGGSRTSRGDISWAELEVPNAPGSTQKRIFNIN